MADNFLYVQSQPFTLSGAGVAMGDTTMVLSSFKQIDGTTNLTMADFGTIGFGTVEPGNGTQEEQISFTGVTQNANGTATLTGIKTVIFTSPYTQTSSFAKTHAGGTQFVISNTSAFYDKLTSKNDDETISGLWTFTNPNYPQIDSSTPLCTLAAQFATKAYVDSVSYAGAPNADTLTKGIVQLATGTQAQAGTALGSTGASLVPPNTLFNATTSANIIIPVTNSSGKISAGFGGSASGLATLDSNTKVVQNPASATTVSTAASIPISDSNGKIYGWGRFGGTGSDGALAISSGTTTINLASAAYVEKNYTSISITGTTGALAFSNPNTNGTVVVFKSQGGVTLTSTSNPLIDLRNLGGAGGAGVSGGTGAGSNGSFGFGLLAGPYPGGAGGVNVAGSAGNGLNMTGSTFGKAINLFCGAGGAGGGTNSSSNNSGAGGTGAGCLYIECGGALNFTGTINAAGSAGGAGSGSTVSQGRGGGGGGGSKIAGSVGVAGNSNTGAAGGGGGGGGGGVVVIVTNTTTANSGTITTTGGSGGSGGDGANGGAGSVGYSAVFTNNDLF